MAEITQLVSGPHLMVSLRRKIASVVLGIFYGGAVNTGISLGIDFVTAEDGFLFDYPLVGAGLWLVAALVAGSLAAYSAQSFLIGVVSGSVMAALHLAAIAYTVGLQQYLWFSVPLLVGASAIAAHYGKQIPISDSDLASGRLFDINWKHWLWLWFPIELMLQNGVWLAYPISLLAGSEISPLGIAYEIIRTPVILVVLGYGCVRAFESISEQAGHTRFQAAARFLFWVVIFPLFVNLLRIFGF